MASYEKRGKKIRAVVSVNDHGTRRKVSRTFDKKRDAVAWTATMESDKYQSKSIIASQMTFAEYFEMWMNREKKPDIRKSTYQTYESALTDVKRYFKDATLADLNYPYLQKMLDDFGCDHSQHTTVMFCNKVKSSLQDALFNEYILKDVFSKVRPRGKTTQAFKKALNASEFETVQAYLYDRLENKTDPKGRQDLMILIALETGMRLGELLALTPRDISTQFNTISISKSYSSTSRVVTEPKTKSSNRVIEIPTSLSKIIKIFINDPLDGERLFTFDALTVRNRLSKLFKQLDIEPVVFHGLRHSHASYLLYKGISINYVSARLGHANTAITQQVYAHMLKEEKDHEGNKAMNLLQQMSPIVPKSKKNAVK
ncbi:tyrosine-type recombinase/integrase [Pediococcus argentinicus]|uniref:tyrosine-type recombinase/integrase n=1 Tax=Pediococcus argentinicus TaxID=480391 RepID=UPI00338F06A6